MERTYRSVKTNNDPEENTVFLEEAIKETGFGLYQILVAVCCGLGAFSGNVAIYVSSFILPTVSCEFQMSASEQTLMTSSSFIGMFCSTHMCGYWGDSYGRRHILWRSCLAVWISMTVMAFSPNASSLIASIFLTGFVSAGINIGVFVYTSESCSIHQRSNMLTLLSVIAYSPYFILPILSGLILSLEINWKINDFNVSPWRVLLLICSVMNLICAAAFFSLPETPKFSLMKGEVLQTIGTLRTMHHINSWKPRKNFKVTSVALDHEDNASEAPRGFLFEIQKQTSSLFRKEYSKYTIFHGLVSMACIGAYNAVFMWLPQWNSQMRTVEGKRLTLCDTFQCETPATLSKNLNESIGAACESFDVSKFSMNIYIGAVCCLSILFLMKLADCFEKRKVIVYLLLGSTIGFVGVIFARSVILTNVLLGVAAILLVVVFPLCVNITVDFFPTNVRSTATCFGFFSGRVGSALTAQIMGSAQQCYCDYVFYGLTAMLLGITLLASLMPLKKRTEINTV